MIWCLSWPKDGRLHRWLASASADVLASAMLGRRNILTDHDGSPSRPHSQVKIVKGSVKVVNSFEWFTDCCWCNEGLESFLCHHFLYKTDMFWCDVWGFGKLHLLFGTFRWHFSLLQRGLQQNADGHSALAVMEWRSGVVWFVRCLLGNFIVFITNALWGTLILVLMMLLMFMFVLLLLLILMMLLVLHVFVFLNYHASFGMLCHPNSALTCPMFLCQRSLRAALLA